MSRKQEEKYFIFFLNTHGREIKRKSDQIKIQKPRMQGGKFNNPNQVIAIGGKYFQHFQ